MNKKNTRYIIIFLALGIIYVLSKYVFVAKPESNFNSNVLKIDTSQVASFSIKANTAKNAIKFFKKEDIWFVKKANKEDKANTETVKELFNVFAQLKVKNVVGLNQDTWKNFKLTDSLATKLNIFDRSNHLIKSLLVGKFTYHQNQSTPYSYGRQNVSGNTYVRLADGKKSFLVNGFLPMMINRDFNQFRNNQLLKLDKNKLSKIIFEYPADTGFTITKQDSMLWLVNGIDTIKQGVINNYLTAIADVKNTSFEDKLKPNTTTIYSLKIEANGLKPISVDFYPKDSVSYFVHSSQFPDNYFSTNQNDLPKQLLKPVEYFKK